MKADRVESFLAQDLAKAVWDANWVEPEDTPTLDSDGFETECTNAPVMPAGANGGSR
jgi:hypothetical protein